MNAKVQTIKKSFLAQFLGGFNVRFLTFGCGVAALGVALGAWGQQARLDQPAVMVPATPQAGCFIVPASHADKPNHTNYLLASADCKTPLVLKQPAEFRTAGPVTMTEYENSPDGIVPAATTELAETPQSLGCLYVNSPATAGCIPNYASGSGGPSAAGYGAIAIVDAYDNPDAATDLATFDSYWGLKAPPSFTKVYANGNGSCTTPAANSGWAVEESLDIEWAHVFAPNAAIVLVEACSSSSADLYYAERVAFNYIVTHFPGIGGQVTNSWGGDEYSTETSADPYFADYNYTCCTWTTHITAFASAGDCGYLNTVNNGPCYSPNNNNYPSVSPWVVSAGGTSILRNASDDKFASEACWSGSGGGPSAYESWANSFTGGNMGPWAPYQYDLFGNGQYGSGYRRTPDLAFDADPASGVYIYSLYGAGGWAVVGGTSVASPSLASIVNRAGNRLGTVNIEPVLGGSNFVAEENNLLYSQLGARAMHTANFYDPKTGSNGGPGATALYDMCTGVGSPRGLQGK
jgi:kumamolisin